MSKKYKLIFGWFATIFGTIFLAFLLFQIARNEIQMPQVLLILTSLSNIILGFCFIREGRLVMEKLS